MKAEIQVLISFGIALAIISSLIFVVSKDYSPDEISVNQWKNMTLQDLNSKKLFKISDYKEDILIIDLFSINNSLNSHQHTIMRSSDIDKKLAVKRLSIEIEGTAPEKVRRYAEENVFEWMFVSVRNDFTESLHKNFDPFYLQVDKNPIIVVCENQSAHLLEYGFKSEEYLLKEIPKVCS